MRCIGMRWSDDEEQTHVWAGGGVAGSRVKSVCLHEWIGDGGSRVARRERVGGERSECTAHVTVDRARGYFSERPKDVAIWSRDGGWLQTPDGGVAVRHGLVRWVHTSHKTSSTGYRLTATAIPFPSLPVNLSCPCHCRSRVRSTTVPIANNAFAIIRPAAKFTWSTDAERHRRSHFEIVIVSKSFRPGARSRPVASFSDKVHARSVIGYIGLANRKKKKKNVIATHGTAVTAARRPGSSAEKCLFWKMTLIGWTSVRTVLLTSLLLTSAVLVVLVRAEDDATLEDDLESLSASNEQPRLDTG